MVSSNIIEKLSSQFGSSFKIQSFEPLGGGSINQAAKINSNFGIFFIKWNFAERHPDMFLKEAESLKILHETKTIKTPKVVFYSEEGPESFLLLEYIEAGKKNKDFWVNFGHSLALMHKYTQSKFGLPFDNYIGSLPQSNQMHNLWIDFFISERLQPQIKQARDQSLIDETMSRDFEKFYYRLKDIFPVEQPALLHGDLWSGNFTSDEMGYPCIFDPAIYFGHRIMDIAMTKMFGGFASEFYEYYNQIFPMENNWLEQVDVANLYPNLVHLNLFGTAYLSGLRSVLNIFK